VEKYIQLVMVIGGVQKYSGKTIDKNPLNNSIVSRVGFLFLDFHQTGSNPRRRNYVFLRGKRRPTRGANKNRQRGGFLV
jgi:hypothetical protein